MIGRATELWEVLLTPQGKEGLRDDISFLNRDLIEMREDLNNSRFFLSFQIEGARNWEGRVCIHYTGGGGG